MSGDQHKQGKIALIKQPTLSQKKWETEIPLITFLKHTISLTKIAWGKEGFKEIPALRGYSPPDFDLPLGLWYSKA